MIKKFYSEPISHTPTHNVGKINLQYEWAFRRMFHMYLRRALFFFEDGFLLNIIFFLIYDCGIGIRASIIYLCLFCFDTLAVNFVFDMLYDSVKVIFAFNLEFLVVAAALVCCPPERSGKFVKYFAFSATLYSLKVIPVFQQEFVINNVLIQRPATCDRFFFVNG